MKMRSEQELLEIQANSFKNFHAKGLDYICISRGEFLTEKVYFFGDDAPRMADVVNPHNHRYNFSTTVLAGVLKDWRYVDEGEPHNHGRRPGGVYNRFDWRTPLNGGDGFTWRGESILRISEGNILRKGDAPFITRYNELHTIEVQASNTVIQIIQREDVVSLGTPTQTYAKDFVAPSLDGLYEKFTLDELTLKLFEIERLRGF